MAKSEGPVRRRRRGGEAEKEAQAREQYFLFRGQVENAVSNVYEVENRLRYMMGIVGHRRSADSPGR